jgi:hypothetical protein
MCLCVTVRVACADALPCAQTVARHEFTASKHAAVSNAMAAHGLDLLAQMMAVRTHPRTPARAHTHAHARARTRTHAHTPTHTHPRTHRDARVQAAGRSGNASRFANESAALKAAIGKHMYARTRARACARTRMHAHARTHASAQVERHGVL